MKKTLTNLPLFFIFYLFLWGNLSATKLVEVKVVDKDYLMVYFKDGDVTFVDDGVGSCAFAGHCHDASNNSVVNYGTALNTTNAAATNTWRLKSSNDAYYGTTGRNPLNSYRKSKLNGMAEFAWAGSDYNYSHTMEHTIYLRLPQSMVQGRTYTLEINSNTNTDLTSVTFTYDIFNSITEAVHVNLVGYISNSGVKAADLYLWMGDAGARDYSSFVGNKVYIYNVQTQQSQEVGTVSLWKTSASEAEGYNFTRSNVWSADFTGFNQPGTYRVVVEGVGCSQDFKIADNVYYDPFKVSTLGFFYMRIGQDNLNMTPVPRRPLYIPNVSPSNTKVFITTMHPYHANWSTFANGDAWDQPDLWASYSTGRTNDNAYGGHSDALDWDRHLGHVSIIYDMLLPYILTNGAISEDNLGIAESGNGVPDVIDEAKNEVDFWLRLRDGQGYGHGLTNPNGSNILYQAGNTAMAAWANALNCAMLAESYRIAGRNTQMEYYRNEAITAYNHANGLQDQMLDLKQNVGEANVRGRDFKMMAAAYLYNLTGNTTYENTMNSLSVVTSPTSTISDKENFSQVWGIAAYTTTHRPVNFATLRNNMISAIINEAKNREANFSNVRPSRRGTDNTTGYFHTIQNMQRSMIAHRVATNQSDKDLFLNAMTLEADWGLGRNPANLIQMTTASTSLAAKRSIENAYTSGRDDGTPGLHPGHTPYLNIDDWAAGMVMGRPSWMYTKSYPSTVGDWPRGELYFNTRYVWAHSEFTPQQTMRGKQALYGYLYGVGKGTISPPPPPPSQYSLTITAVNGSVSKNPNKTAYESGESVIITATPGTGYSFTSWSGDASGSTNPLTVSMNSNKNITANFSATASCTGTGSISYARYEGITGTAISNLTSSSKFPNSPDFTTALNSFEAPTNIMDNYGVLVRGYICPPATGSYTFWIAGDDNVELWLSTNDSPSNKVRIAHHTGWTSSREWNKYTTQKSSMINLTAGQRYYVEALMKEGTGGDNMAVGWLRPGQSGTVPSEVIPGSALMPFSTAPSTFTLNITATNGSVAKNPNKTSYTSGESVTLTATANSGYVFNGWSGDASGSTNPLVVTMNSNKNITANFTQQTTSNCVLTNPSFESDLQAWTINTGTIAVSTDATNGSKSARLYGSASGMEQSYVTNVAQGTSITLSFDAKIAGSVSWAGVGLDFKDVNGNDLQKPNIQITNTSWQSRTIVASAPAGTARLTVWAYTGSGELYVDNFCISGLSQEVTYSLNLSATNGTVTKNPNKTSYASGESVTLTATASSGYSFSGWSGDASGTTNPLTITMNSNKNITANFTAITTYSLNVSATNGSVTKNPNKTSYANGESVTLTATASSGYSFSGWSGDASGTTNPLTITMNSNKNITANFIAASNELVIYKDAGTLISGTWNNNGTISESTSGAYEGTKHYQFNYNISNWYAGVGLNLDNWGGSNGVNMSGYNNLSIAFNGPSSSSNSIRVKLVDKANVSGPEVTVNRTTSYTLVNLTLASLKGTSSLDLTKIKEIQISISGTQTGSGILHFDNIVLTGSTSTSSLSTGSASVKMANYNEPSIKAYNIYPNPANGFVMMTFNKEAFNNSVLRIVNANGAIIYEKNVYNTSELRIETSDFKRGLYLIIVSSPIVNISEKLILQ